ncbi:hypothetical protein FOXG_22831 [Fusarium oxysporum f. sp. lycopersici 4287]|uniref:Uncharacterized protein n=1 Tax=Fusarium oxysporum f. sp. lycopersici (strain 4287 / CBS 123668 / FGSC 9935 / NRRL 34936) TaxID=426428 RepID=A0A0J9WW12_FUSO4|nr:uncharacterized protein FOXG_22831 [Fusarium oxysporum f. sp. lycopersici 4287]KNB20477.1 hypothetical protein FOXG_22831 [Fusarium oxysporum f. sp. lycopersici 4287]
MKGSPLLETWPKTVLSGSMRKNLNEISAASVREGSFQERSPIRRPAALSFPTASSNAAAYWDGEESWDPQGRGRRKGVAGSRCWIAPGEAKSVVVHVVCMSIKSDL